MAVTTARATTMHAYEHERIREVLARVKDLNSRSNKHQHIRINHWVKKLLDQPVTNATWLKNVMEHSTSLLQMLLDGVVEEPFSRMPPQGPLSTLPRHKVARSGGKGTGHLSRPMASRAMKHDASSQLLQRLLHGETDGQEEIVVKKKVMESKLIQTSDQDDQWDWQRVWKGAFEKMQSQLKERNAHIQAVTAEMKELRALVAAQKHALEQQERIRDDLQAKHRAELDNLKSVHSLEIDTLKAKQKKQIQEVALQNESLLRERRREKEKQMGGAFNMQSDSYGDFLSYIDDFYTDTLKLTQTQSA